MSRLGTVAEWWMSTKSPPEMFRPLYQTAEINAYLREHVGIDAAILSAELGIHTDQVKACQRRLGLRKLTGNRSKRSTP